jgi:hypothetical protein
MTIDSSGRVGIGTNSPTTALDFGSDFYNGTPSTLSQLINKVSLYADGSGPKYGLGISDSALNITAGANGDIRLHTNGANERMRIDSSGNVGIGGTQASSKLFVDNGAGTRLYIGLSNNIYADAYEHIWRSPSAAAERMRIDSSGRVGIGQTAPKGPLHVYGTNYSYFTSNVAGVTPHSTTQGIALGWNKSSGAGESIIAHNKGGGSGGGLVFANNDGGVYREDMRIDSSGNVLVGKTSTTFNTAGIALRSADVLQVTRSGDTALELNRTTNDGKLAEFYKDGTSVGSIGNNGNRPYFASTNCGIRLGAADLLPATSTGVISDNVVSLGSSSGRWKDLYLSGTANVGSVVATGNVTAYSDIRLKEDIQPIESAASKVQQLTGNTYTRNDLEDTDRRYGGVLAQEVELVLPEAISETEDGIKTVDYNALIALLVESVKELKAEVDLLKGSI